MHLAELRASRNYQIPPCDLSMFGKVSNSRTWSCQKNPLDKCITSTLNKLNGKTLSTVTRDFIRVSLAIQSWNTPIETQVSLTEAMVYYIIVSQTRISTISSHVVQCLHQLVQSPDCTITHSMVLRVLELVFYENLETDHLTMICRFAVDYLGNVPSEENDLQNRIIRILKMKNGIAELCAISVHDKYNVWPVHDWLRDVSNNPTLSIRDRILVMNSLERI